MKIINRKHNETYMLVNIGQNQTEVEVAPSQVRRFFERTGLNSLTGLVFVGDDGQEFVITCTGSRATRVYTMCRKT